MGSLTDRILRLENKIYQLENKIKSLSQGIENKRIRPETRVSKLDLTKRRNMPSTGTGLGKIFGETGNIIWNDADLGLPAWGQQPDEPEKGWNKHGHSRYSGGALDINTLELVEFETHEENVDALGYPVILDNLGNPVNKHCQSYWKVQPSIKKDAGVEKIGLLDIQFDSASKKWVAGGGSIDVEKTYLIQYIWKKDGIEVPEGTEGATKEIKTDGNGVEMKSPLLYTEGDTNTIAGRNENLNKSNVYWDENAECWRFYAVFKPYPEEEE